MENIWLDLNQIYVNRHKYLIMFYSKYMDWLEYEMTDTDDEYDDLNGSVLKPLN